MPTYTIAPSLWAPALSAEGGGRGLARDQSGRLWVPFCTGVSPATYHGLRCAYSDDGGVTWTIEQVNVAGSYDIFPAIAVDSAGTVHVVYAGRRAGIWELLYRQRTGVGWGAEEVIASIAGRIQDYSAIAIDSADDIHVVWSGSGWGANPATLNMEYRMRNAVGGWNPIEAITDLANSQTFPCVAIDSASIIHVVWNHRSQDIRYRQRLAGVWQAVENVTNVGAGQTRPRLAIDSSNNIRVIWVGTTWGANPANRNVEYRARIGGVWQAVEGVTDINANQDYPSIALDLSDNVHAVWNGLGWGANPARDNVQHRQRTAAGWQAQTAITDEPLIRQRYSSLLWAMHPTVAGLKPNILASGFALVFESTDEAVKFHSGSTVWAPPFRINRAHALSREEL